jgi:hypothetical protein
MFMSRSVSTPLDDWRPAVSLLREDLDARWVACQRPFIVAGGELTLEMLDLRQGSESNFYVAPLHVKALGGCLLIDDFGRQMVSPTARLNRWIVPLESRMDYLKLNTGKSFAVPFEAMVLFSTNLEPADLMDPAFLRRIPYKLEIGAPAAGDLSTHFRIRSDGERHDAHQRGLQLYRPRNYADPGGPARRLPAAIPDRPDRRGLPLQGKSVRIRSPVHRLRAQQSDCQAVSGAARDERPCVLMAGKARRRWARGPRRPVAACGEGPGFGAARADPNG